MRAFCFTRNDVFRLLLDNPGDKFYVEGYPEILHTFEECLLTPFITINTITEQESYKFHVKDSELMKMWVKY